MADAGPQPIAVVGMAGRFPGAGSLDDLWRTIRDGVEVLTPLSDADLDAARVDPAIRADPRYVRAATLLADADRFDAAFFGVSPREAQILDPQQRVFLECAWEALEHAGHSGAVGQAVGVYAGVGMNSYFVTQLLQNPAFLASVGGYQAMVGSDKDFLATRVSYKLDLRGPSLTVQTACSTSLVAVTLACRALQRGECDLALAGGVSILFPQGAGYLYEEGMIFSPDGHCRPFDSQAKGTRGSSGAGVVALRRLSDALADGDAVHAVILGAAINNDGAAKAGYTAPSVEGQVEVIATAHALAGVDPRTIGYVEAHGTGTPLGDPIELAALTQAFRAATPDVGFCRLGSLKANLGHLDAAAGVASLIKTVLCLEHGELPPLVNFARPNPQLALESSPFTASAEAAPWPAGRTPRRAGVSSFGIGGTNAHVVVEAAPVPAARPAGAGPHLLVLSARTPAALDQASLNLSAHLRAHPEVPLGDVAWTLQAGRRAFPHRRAVVARGAADAADALATPQRPPAITGSFDGAARPVAFLFSGQGSQHLRMGAGLHRTEPVYREAFDRCAAILAPHLGQDLRAAVLGDGPAAALDETRLTQPALFAVEYALATLWTSRGVRPAAMLGHSIGEYVAAHLAGVLSLEDALKLVAARGRLMQALPAGSMAAVPLGEADLARYLVESGGVEIAARNAPGLCTVSGPKEAVAALVARLTAAGVEARPLHTSHAFHSAMMEPALAPFEAVVREVTLSAPRLPYPSNVTGAWITAAEATSPAYYAEHLRRAVRFEEGVRLLAADPAALLLEVGPGNALTALARMTVGKDGPRRVLASLPHPREGRPDEEAALEAAGRLWVAGAALDWKGLHAAARPRRVPLPTYPFERKRHWVDAAPAAAAAAQAAQVPGVPAPAARVDDWFHVPTWTRHDPAPGAPRLQGAWLVLGEPGPLRDAVAREVAAAGGRAVAAEAADRVDPDAAGAIDLRTLPGCGAAGQDPVARSYHALVALAERAQGRPFRIVVATRGAQSVLDERVEDLDALLVTGPVLALPTEVPALRMRAVDLDPARAGDLAAGARALVEEAALYDGGAVVARRGPRRWVRRHEATPLAPADPAALALRPGGVWLVTGGLGGIGLAVARWLAERAKARLLLTARTPLPPRDAWSDRIAQRPDDPGSATLRGLLDVEAAGGEVLVHAADVADPAAMRAAVDAAVARWGGVHGLVHAAGWSGDDRVAFLKQPADVARVLAAKRDGLRVLTALLGDRPLDAVVLLGTVSAAVGAPGLADYAAANAILDGFPDSAERPAAWKRVVAVDYAAWRDVGMAARIERRGAGRDAFLRWGLPTAGAVDAFGRAVACGRPRVVVAPFPPDAARPDLRREEDAAPPAAEPRAPAAGQERPAVAADYAAPGTDAERTVAAIWSELLGVERIGVDDDFFELGGHSLLATRVLARIDQSLHAKLTLRDVFEAPTVRKLAARIGAAPAPAQAPSGDGDREEIEF